MAEVYASSARGLVGYLTVLTGSRTDAEELTQDAFVKLLQHWPKVREYDDPVAWLRQVATRAAISRARRRQVATLGLRRLSTTAPLTTPGPSATVEHSVDVDAALATLPLTHRAVVLLHYLHDLSVAEIASLLGVAPGTVKSRLSRARSALAPLLEEDHELR
ncbi:MAG: sigma-70 family RNA polymerase sigma factor [Nocardioides sp.]|uniref:RNA polymerase sigma factor n=1 Tax=Nocardioides sp. TaxID=35761 RepID=UPI0039E697F9